MSYFPEPHNNKNKIEMESKLSNYATKSDLKNAKGVDTLEIAKRADLASLISEVDKLDVDKLKNVRIGLNSLKSKADKLDVEKLKPVSADLKKLSDVADNGVVKKTVYGELVKKGNAINISGLVKKQIMVIR